LNAALLVIDLEKAFVLPNSPFEVKGALKTIPNCKKVIEASRSHGMPVVYVKRLYRGDGSDVELVRLNQWLNAGMPLTVTSTDLLSAEYVDEIKPQPGDYLIVKKRFSAFFMTELDLLLRRLGVEVLAIIGTQTPNCIRATVYDALSLDYEVIIIEDCTSSQDEEVQKANIRDLRNLGCIIISSDEYVMSLPNLPSKRLLKRAREVLKSKVGLPHSLVDVDGRRAVLDRW